MTLTPSRSKAARAGVLESQSTMSAESNVPTQAPATSPAGDRGSSKTRRCPGSEAKGVPAGFTYRLKAPVRTSVTVSVTWTLVMPEAKTHSKPLLAQPSSVFTVISMLSSLKNQK